MMAGEARQGLGDDLQRQEQAEDAELQELLQSLLLSGLSTPDDLRRVGFHDHELCGLTVPQRPADVTQRAVERDTSAAPGSKPRMVRKRQHGAGRCDEDAEVQVNDGEDHKVKGGMPREASERARATRAHDAVKAERSATMLRQQATSCPDNGNTALRFTGLEASVVRAIATCLCEGDTTTTITGACDTAVSEDRDGDDNTLPLVYNEQR